MGHSGVNQNWSELSWLHIGRDATPLSEQKVRTCQAIRTHPLKPDRRLIGTEIEIKLGAAARIDHQVRALRDADIGDEVLDAGKAGEGGAE
jgi:hypothetical protein